MKTLLSETRVTYWGMDGFECLALLSSNTARSLLPNVTVPCLFNVLRNVFAKGPQRRRARRNDCFRRLGKTWEVSVFCLNGTG